MMTVEYEEFTPERCEVRREGVASQEADYGMWVRDPKLMAVWVLLMAADCLSTKP